MRCLHLLMSLWGARLAEGSAGSVYDVVYCRVFLANSHDQGLAVYLSIKMSWRVAGWRRRANDDGVALLLLKKEKWKGIEGKGRDERRL
mmetsp:Transcript_48181/g.134710  ORF Transcript_48181/g.134710 Transcript_48181/m.134710 type:complete len:89 (+) Transcript_48181:215-481(+)